MIQINENYSKLQASYLFVEIARRVAEFQSKNPGKELIKMGIGDVTKPLPEACLKAFHEGVDELASEESFKGYGPEKGYPFLREAIAVNDFQSRGVSITANDIFVSDGAKCDTGNFQELFSLDARIAVPDPVYPVYVDTNVMAGRSGEAVDGRYEGFSYLEGNEENGFVPSPEGLKADLIYLCYPNNPTGAVASKAQLQEWVDYAIANKALILFDAAYEAFIRDADVIHSIYEIPGAEKVAVEFRSFSKTAGFTGTRCAYTVIPTECQAYDSKGNAHNLQNLWNRRHSTKFNGVSYPVQKAAAAVYSDEGKQQVKALSDYYLNNASIILEKMKEAGFSCTGGVNSPYIWVNTGRDSWETFDMILNKAGVVLTPGSGFGNCGEGFIRISAFNSLENVEKAMDRIVEALK
ncbi:MULTISPECIES: LL-diaminopimelate aminotransferase [unclassified Oceanispirochaeta]|uniref:LL-diaminopimelate aminotransferase n=1 Tax=unclassified Oceanispirochaeta TaxID=2635722 RepID=UPI000E094812|nr:MULTISPECIES: LL-diaminopimelate aminotransferase [unclassified Oceanispirochaeta]MBF9018389.1 LL-diaminopimelate aminotransferase [Oceanispirochaeta sp. M2]NPD75197.1 LL-diaminopimelate aminotransferase [Oceanispirochaeta sp. M1]RDG28947.1 LL-diaminopimelate aminotransferase [Oceanispirochaeta sp. M1]